MNTTETGKSAEELVANLLKSRKHKIIEMNWRTRWCEIDIISRHKKVIYFTEVKFRSSSAWGDGFSYITKSKLKQMRFAAEFWLSAKDWNGECVIQAAEVNDLDEVNIVEIVD